MTFDARVMTVEAIDCAVDCRTPLLRVDWSLFSAGSQSPIALRLGRMTNLQTKNTTIATTTTPAITPPTIGPIGVLGLVASCPGKDPIFTHFVDAQSLQDWETS